MGPTDYWSIGTIILTGGISLGVYKQGQADVVRRLGELKDNLEKLDRVKLSKEVSDQIVLRLDKDIADTQTGLNGVRGEIGSVRGELSSVRHSVRNLEQRTAFVGPLTPRG